MNRLFLMLARAFAALAILLLAAAPAPAQVGGPGTGGLVRLAQERVALDNPYRVLLIGAHPDDEDNTLIAVLSRGWGVRTAYLSLTRGEGGQNLIGGELGAALGVLRASELVAARAVDGGEQYFTRAFDFGFSKTAAETFQSWPRDSVLKDVVRIVRRFRPHVIVSMFSGTPRDGHGHHQAAGILAREAFDLAADGSRFPELLGEEGLPPWRPLKFYRDYGVTEGITLEGGALDPATGHTLYQLSRRSRSQHRSQDMGALEELGPARARIQLEARAPGLAIGPDSGIFHGIPLDRTPDPARAARIRMIERGIVADGWVTDHEVAPGQRFPLTLVAFNGGADTVEATFDWSGPATFVEDSLVPCVRRPVRVAPGQRAECVVPLLVDPRALPGQPYYLQEAVVGNLYQYTGGVADRGRPFEAPLRAAVTIRFADDTRAIDRPEVMARVLDQGLGEVRRPVTVVPRLLLDIAPGRFVWPRGLRTRQFVVTVEQASRDSLTARIRLRVPAGWRVDTVHTVRLSTEGERRSLLFDVSAPPDVADGEVAFLAEAILESDSLRLGARRIAYPHIRERLVFHFASATAVVAPVRFADRRVGYLVGAADAIPQALAAAGVPLRLLGDAELEGPALDSLDVVVIGPRAYETSEALRRAHPRLLRFAERGGTLVIQYQQYQFVQGGYPPLPLTMGRPHDRVTDEGGAVRWLPGSEAVRRGPNTLSDTDFAGWIQERGLYFAATWDPRWVPMLEMDEPDEAPKRGGLLVARLGRGTVVYTGIAFFRQIPAAVPGAWRLFANLLALR